MPDSETTGDVMRRATVDGRCLGETIESVYKYCFLNIQDFKNICTLFLFLFLSRLKAGFLKINYSEFFWHKRFHLYSHRLKLPSLATKTKCNFEK